MRTGDYTVTVRDETGAIILDAAVDATLRQVRRLDLPDDGHLRPLPITTSVLSGHVAGVLTEYDSRARLPVTPTPPASLTGDVLRPETGVGATPSNGGHTA